MWQQEAYDVTPLLAGHALRLPYRGRSESDTSPDEEEELQPAGKDDSCHILET